MANKSIFAGIEWSNFTCSARIRIVVFTLIGYAASRVGAERVVEFAACNLPSGLDI